MDKLHSKLLLFGEYGLMFGAKALAVPFPKYSGQLLVAGSTLLDKKSSESKAELARFSLWMEREQINRRLHFPLDVELFKHDLEENLYFQSDIPRQYGLGSSGALCAALFKQYGMCKTELQLLPLKEDFAVLESYFHGKSSGLDPLVSFLNKPVLLEKNKLALPTLTLSAMPWSVYLIDTGTTAATSPLVSIFLKKMEDAVFADLFRNVFLSSNDGAVDAFLRKDSVRLFDHLQEITRFQLANFPEMVPPHFFRTINHLSKQGICVKLLGSGGGGFLLAFVPNGMQFPKMENSIPIFQT